MTHAWLQRPEGGTVLGYRLMSGFGRLFGRTAARLTLYPITLYYLLRRAPERRASHAYLTRVLGRPATIGHVARHMFTFAAITLDRLFLLSERFKRFDVRVHGLEELRAAWAQQRGVLLFGSHLGSFEALRVLSQLRPDVKLRVVIDLEQNPALSRIIASFNPQLAASIINARQDGAVTALAIKEALDEKALVTVLVDRTRPGNATVTAPFFGSPAAFPAAPWQLAAVLKAPVVLGFGLYRGGNRYDLHFESFADVIKIERTRREAALREIIERFAGRLEHYTRSAAYNWFNFYDFWTPVEDTSALRGDAERADGVRSAERR